MDFIKYQQRLLDKVRRGYQEKCTLKTWLKRNRKPPFKLDSLDNARGRKSLKLFKETGAWHRGKESFRRKIENDPLFIQSVGRSQRVPTGTKVYIRIEMIDRAAEQIRKLAAALEKFGRIQNTSI